MYCTLRTNEAHLYADHLKRLDKNDRMMRFSTFANDTFIDRYVNGLDFEISKIKAIFIDGKIVGAVHIVRVDMEIAEIGISVDSDCRGKGYGKLLFDAAVLWCQNHGVKKIITVCMSGNKWMLNTIKKYKGELQIEYGQAEGSMPVERANIFSYTQEMLQEMFGVWKAYLPK